MKKFNLTLLLFFLPLLCLILLTYIILDPFKVIYKYREQVNTDKKYQLWLNRDFQSTQLLLWNYKESGYNSFILGNSRSFFYQAKTFHTLTDGNVFHFNASGESIFGINGKLKLLDELNVNIKNVLIVLDAGTLKITQNSTGHLYIKHPRVSGESPFTFHKEMFGAFFPKAMIAYVDLSITKKKKKYMTQFGIIDNLWKHDVHSNQLISYVSDQQIETQPVMYYADKMHLFYKRSLDQKFSPPCIYNEQEKLLKNIQFILKSNKTSYKIIINPLYDQIKINSKDLDYLKDLFGADNVFDFSGINFITNDYHNYYETSHYRPFICDSMLNIVYKHASSN